MNGMHPTREEYTSVTLSCLHDAIFYPVPFMNDIVFCSKCWKYRRVIAGGPERRSANKLRIRCRSCRFARYETAKRSKPENREKLTLQAESHMLRTGHVVDLKQGRELLATLTPKPSLSVE